MLIATKTSMNFFNLYFQWMSPLKCITTLFVFVAWISTAHANSNVMSACGIPVQTNDKFPELSNKILVSIRGIAQIKGAGNVSPLHAKHFGNFVDGQLYCQYLKARIRKILIEPSVSTMDALHNGTVRIGPNMVDDDYFSFMMALVHEAAHYGDGHHVYHEECPSTYIDYNGQVVSHPWKSNFACDDVEDGANGIGIIWAKNVQMRCTNCPEDFLEPIKTTIGMYFLKGFRNSSSQQKLIKDFNTIMPPDIQISTPLLFLNR